MVDDLFGGALLHDVAALHKDHTAGYLAGKADLMGDDDHRHAVRRQLFHNLQNLADHLRVQRRGRLVKEQDLGIQLVNITIQDSEPPTQEVMKAFKAVETAKQGKETALNNANKYRNEKLPEAEAEADQIIQDAEAQKKVRINEAEAEVARFNAMYEEYVKNPEITKKRMFYEAMEDVLPGMKIVIDNGDGVQKVLPLDSFTGNSSENPTETLNTDPAQDTQDLNDSKNE